MWDWMDRAALWLSVAFVLVVVWAELAMRHIGGDPLWDYKTGLWQLAHGSVARRDLWAQGQPSWVNPEWLWADVLALAGRAGYVGWALVSEAGFALWVAGLLVLGSFYRVSRGMMVLAVLIGTIIVLPWWGFRPQVWAYGWSVWAFWALSWLARELRSGFSSRARWMVAGLVGWGLVWAQFHGSWLLLPVWGVVEGVLVVRRWRVALGWFVGSGLFTVLVGMFNPWGWSYIVHSIRLTGNSVISMFIAEWMTPNFHIGYVVLGFAVFGFGALVGVLGRRWPDLAWQVRSLVYVLGFIGAALYAVRFMPYLPMGFLAAVGSWEVGARRVLPWVSGVVLMLFPVWLYYGLTHMPVSPILSPASVSAVEEPVGVVPVLRRERVRDLFSQYRWGGFLEAYGFTPWIDGRGEMWSRIGRLSEYVAGRGGFGNPLAVVARSGDRWALLSPGNPYYWAVGQSPAWQRVAGGRGWVLFRRVS